MAGASCYVGRCRRCLAFVTQVVDDPGKLEAVAEAVAGMILADLKVITLPEDEARLLRERFARHEEGCLDSPEVIAARWASSVAEEHRQAMADEPAPGLHPESRQLLAEVLERHGAVLTSYYPTEDEPRQAFPIDRSAR